MSVIETFARTEVGCSRERNEDSFLVADVSAGIRTLTPEVCVKKMDQGALLVAVCDGMGGMASGDAASQIAVDELWEVTCGKAFGVEPEPTGAVLQTAFRQANQAIVDYAAMDETRTGMGTTMTAAIVVGRHVHLGHVGDSRAYLLRGKNLCQLTRDHTLVADQVEAGRISAEQARHERYRNVLLRALGAADDCIPDLLSVSLFAGDVILLCSDGLNEVLDDAQISSILLRFSDPVRACRALTEAACAAGGPDNITVVVFRCVGPGFPLPQGRQPVEIQPIQLN